jgi:predicted DsbA family dithiol-disulfide isomerase
VQTDFSFSLQLGAPGTPGFLINGSPGIFGAQALGTFEHAIDQAARGPAAGLAGPR